MIFPIGINKNPINGYLYSRHPNTEIPLLLLNPLMTADGRALLTADGRAILI